MSKTSFKIVVADDDRELRQSLEHLLTRSGWEVDVFADARSALSRLKDLEPDVILSDVRMPGMSGLEFLAALDKGTAPPLVLISAHGDISMAVQAMQDGAYSFLEKPFDPRQLLRVLRHAAENHRLLSTTKRLRAQLSELSGIDRVLLGASDSMTALRNDVFEIADTKSTVLIQGETGTGKELIARALHAMSPRSDQPFMPVNCANMPPETMELQMFGAVDGPQGFFRKAEGGTIFLDEAGAFPLEAQAKLLRALETGEITPAGSDEVIRTDVRVIAASNENLEAKAREGRFRADFLYRLNTFQIELPALRTRGEDVIMIFQHFVTQVAETYEVQPPELTAGDAATLLSYDWPGNVRELRHVAERRVLAARRGGGSVAAALRIEEGDQDIPETLREAIAAFERTLISKSIKTHGGRMESVAEALGIGRRTLNDKIVKLGIAKDVLLED
ncbi:sigma-54-dependent transcriptional regulator [Candidatus Halocynthiibacter alkanivorans]|uniref:sigma-54-dependent transcriptional regulator n=1 Tax=Candidatus Halocynthiibacter alkanivorans TaxID=2267619 RepID=UPI000DF3D5AE|nr:sigma-54 dependent transcriptional regulator [Candidatus Halocynthiibacter alkanivorans]